MSILARAVREMRGYLEFTTSGQQDFWGGKFPGGIGTYAGLTVTQTTAMTCSAVYAAVALISETIATLPFDVYQRYGDGSRYPRTMPDANGRGGWVVKPNPEVDAVSFRQQGVTSLLQDGNAFIGINRLPGSREPVSLWVLNPTAVSITRNLQSNTLDYRVSLSTGEQIMMHQGEDILHIRGLFMPGDMRGLSPLELARQSIGRTLAAEKLGATIFANGAMPGTVLTSQQPLRTEMAKDMQERFDAAHKGSGNAWKTVVLGSGVDVKSVQMSPEQVQMLETMRYGISDVARWFRVPPHLIGDVERSTSWGSGIAEQNTMFAIHTLGPWIVRFEQAFNELLFDTFADRAFYCKFNTKAFLRGNPTEQADYLMKKIQAQAATPNEWRSLDDENPLPDGGKVLQSVQFTPKVVAQPADEEAPELVPSSNGGGST